MLSTKYRQCIFVIMDDYNKHMIDIFSAIGIVTPVAKIISSYVPSMRKRIVGEMKRQIKSKNSSWQPTNHEECDWRERIIDYYRQYMANYDIDNSVGKLIEIQFKPLNVKNSGYYVYFTNDIKGTTITILELDYCYDYYHMCGHVDCDITCDTLFKCHNARITRHETMSISKYIDANFEQCMKHREDLDKFIQINEHVTTIMSDDKRYDEYDEMEYSEDVMLFYALFFKLAYAKFIK